MNESPPRRAVDAEPVDFHRLVVRTAFEAYDDRERHRIARRQRPQQAARRQDVERRPHAQRVVGRRLGWLLARWTG